MKKQFVLLYGPPGSGKTTIGKAVNREIERSMFMDVDDLWNIEPFVVNDDNKKMVESNIISVIGHFIENPSVDVMIMAWVVHTKELVNFFKTITCDYMQCKCTYIRLYAKEEVLRKRMTLQGRDDQSILQALDMSKGYPALEDYLVDTSKKDLCDVTSEVQKIIKKDTPTN